MRLLHVLSGISCLLLAATAPAQQLSSTAFMGASFQEDEGGGLTLALNVDNATGPYFYVQMTTDDFATSSLVGPFALDMEGNAYVAGKLAPKVVPPDFRMSFRAVFKGGPLIKTTNTARLVFGDEGCDRMDVDVASGAVPMPAGELAAEQWAPIGMHLSATSQLASQPNKCIVFDSAVPSIADPDLATPGYGPNNKVAYGKMLIVAENDIDANADGYVDEPDDAYNGGLIHFNFDEPQTICSVTLVDIDDSEPGTGVTKLRFYQDNAGTQQISAITVLPMGDNSVQTLQFRVYNVRRMDVKMGGSGGVPQISMCPTIVDFDQNTFGVPLDFDVGEVIHTQYEFVGLHIWADNAHVGGPNKAIIFDSSNPTGGDFDLATPGYGQDNVKPEGRILIIAENVIDANGDGLVDDPDDEAQGGRLVFDFAFPVRVGQLVVVDVDGSESSWVECRDENELVVESGPLASMGDNSCQTVSMQATNVRRLIVRFGGSGSVASMKFCPTE